MPRQPRHELLADHTGRAAELAHLDRVPDPDPDPDPDP